MGGGGGGAHLLTTRAHAARSIIFPQSAVGWVMLVGVGGRHVAGEVLFISKHWGLSWEA